MSARLRRRAVTGVAALAASSLLAGCGLGNGLYNVPLPGGADLGSHPYTVTVEFTDAEDLVPQSGVKVNDVSVGRVSKIGLDRTGKIAEVSVELNGSVRLPANAVASIQQTSLLGEKYVSLSAPTGSSGTGRLLNHARIPLARSSDGVEIEQVLGALSLLLNAGGIGQLHDIAHELNAFAGGREDQLRTFFTKVDSTVATLNKHRSSITNTLDALDTLSKSLRDQNSHIAEVLQSLAPGLEVIAQQHKQLTGALTALNNLSTVTVSTLDASKDDIVADFRLLAPILTQLANADTSLPRSLQDLLTFPFTDGAVQGIKGDYLNAFATLVLRTPGGMVYPTLPAPIQNETPALRRANVNLRVGSTATVPTPSGLLPPTSSSAVGLPSTITETPTSSAPGTSTGASSPSGGSSSASSSNSSSGSSSPSSSKTPSSPSSTSSSNSSSASKTTHKPSPGKSGGQ